MMRILTLLALFLFVFPMILSLGLFGLGVTGQVWLASYMMTMFAKTDVVPRKKEWNVVNIDSNENLHDAYRSVIEPDTLMRERRVSFDAIVGLETIPARDLTPGLDAGNSMRIYAPQFAIEECARLKQVLATDCAVNDTQVSSRNDGTWRISATLSFTQKDVFGFVAPGVPLMFVEADQQLGDGTIMLNPISRAGQTEARMTMYKRAAAVCQKVRDQRGNCALTRIDVGVSDDTRTTSRLLRPQGKATVAFLQPA